MLDGIVPNLLNFPSIVALKCLFLIKNAKVSSPLEDNNGTVIWCLLRVGLPPSIAQRPFFNSGWPYNTLNCCGRLTIISNKWSFGNSSHLSGDFFSSSSSAELNKRAQESRY